MPACPDCKFTIPPSIIPSFHLPPIMFHHSTTSTRKKTHPLDCPLSRQLESAAVLNTGRYVHQGCYPITRPRRGKAPYEPMVRHASPAPMAHLLPEVPVITAKDLARKRDWIGIAASTAITSTARPTSAVQQDHAVVIARIQEAGEAAAVAHVWGGYRYDNTDLATARRKTARMEENLRRHLRHGGDIPAAAERLRVAVKEERVIASSLGL